MRGPSRASLAAALLGALAACVPADEAAGLGSVEFTFVATDATTDGVAETVDGWSIRFDRVVLSFKTMTIGKIGVQETCAYRGRGASADVVFDPRQGLVQSFNGIKAVDCPDVGIIFGPPDSLTTLGAGIAPDDVVDLAADVPAHGLIDATATNIEPYLSGFDDPTSRRTVRIRIRLDSTHTATRFGGCHSDTADPAHGIRIAEGERDLVAVRFAAESLFRDSVGPGANLRIKPLYQSDRDGDGVVTMDELERVPLRSIVDVGNYRLPDGSNAVSLAEYLRVQFRFAFTFRGDGACVGNEPGSEEGGQPAP